MGNNIKDYATSTVATAPSPATSGTSLDVASGHGSRFPAAPFSVTVHPTNEMPTLDSAERLLVTGVSGDTFTVVRAQGDTTAKSIADGWRITNTLFKSDLDEKADASSVPTSLDDLSGTLDDITEGSTNKHFKSTEKSKLSGIAAGAEVNTVVSVAGKTGAVSLAKADVGLENVDNTSNATERAAAVTLNNKRINPRVSSAASASSLTPNISSFDQYVYTALAANLTINAPAQTLVTGSKLLFAIKDNGTSRTLTWNAAFAPVGVTLPTATTAGKWTYVGCIYNNSATRWDVIAVTTEA